jgi:tRNA pseudouridine(55) synthase
MEKVLKLYKNLGETPLECLERFRSENPEYADVSMTYAGRLDPMAEGLLIALVGEECKKKDEYLGLDKEYIFEVLFGIQTDTYDILGIPTLLFPRYSGKITRFDPGKFIGKRIQEYPPYSSKTIAGKPLFQIAREGYLGVEPQKREIEIYDLEILEEKGLDARTVLASVLERIGLVKGDFRQKETESGWQNLLGEIAKQDLARFQIVKFKISCSSGTYIRSVANEMGGIAWSIKRTKVGDFAI